MSIVQSIILGIVQGLTEFLPISSTAHLTFVGRMFGLIDSSAPEQWTSFIATIQLGTLISVLWYFAGDIRKIIVSLVAQKFRYKKPDDDPASHYAHLGWLVAIGTIPVVVIGLAFKKIIEGSITKDLTVLATTLIVFAVILFIAERVARHVRRVDNATMRDALLVGLAQACALIPGASRSGTTLTGALLLGFKREDAARFSFLLSIPAVAASGMLEFATHYKLLSHHDLLAASAAIIAAAISGYFTIRFFLGFLKTHSTNLFIVYRIALGIIILIGISLKSFQP